MISFKVLLLTGALAAAPVLSQAATASPDPCPSAPKAAIALAEKVADYQLATMAGEQAVRDGRNADPTGWVQGALFVGLADPRQATAVATLTRLQLTAPGGRRTTQIPSGQQWDDPNGWPPLQWIAISGLDAYGFHKQARDLAARFVGTVDAAYRGTGSMLEKYDVEQRKPGGGGEYPLQDGFGWTNGVTRAILAKYPDLDPEGDAE